MDEIVYRSALLLNGRRLTKINDMIDRTTSVKFNVPIELNKYECCKKKSTRSA